MVTFSRWVLLLRALIGVRGVRGVLVTPSGEEALAAVLGDLTGWSVGSDVMAPVTIPQVWHALPDPSAAVAEECRYADPEEMRRECRTITDALGVMVRGSLAGLFDAPTNVDLDWAAPIQSLGSAAGRCRGWGRAVRLLGCGRASRRLWARRRAVANAATITQVSARSALPARAAVIA